MKAQDSYKQRMERLQRTADRCGRIYEKELQRAAGLLERAIAELEQEREQSRVDFEQRIAQVQEQMNQAGKDFAKTKYQLERDYAANKNEIHKAAEDLQAIHRRADSEIGRLKEEKVNLQVSFERQKSALQDLYEEKRRHLTITSAKFIDEWKNVDGKLRAAKERYDGEIRKINEEGSQKLNALNEQASAKRQGWSAALDTMRRELESLTQEKAHLEKQLAEIRSDKEKELETTRLTMSLSKEQLEIDKATLVEKAEEDQRKMEADINEMKSKIAANERDLQELTLSKETQKKHLDEGFQKEEGMLKDAVKAESEKRDFEQKLFGQEKSGKEKEVARLREEYEKRKWQWDNQIRTLMMQKSVQDAEHDAERMRTDREARMALRGLEAQRDELKHRLADLKSKYDALTANSRKEQDLVHQRWRWRKDRLWTMWQGRLDLLRKERKALQEQIEHVQAAFDAERAKVSEAEQSDAKRIQELQNFVMQGEERSKSQSQQRAIQLELEKTRIVAQIKECETLVADWMLRLKTTHDEIAANNTGLVAQINYLDRWSRDEEKETELFLHALQRALTVFEGAFGDAENRRAA